MRCARFFLMSFGVCGASRAGEGRAQVWGHAVELAEAVRSICRVFRAASLGAGRVVLAVKHRAPRALSTRRWQVQPETTPDVCVFSVGVLGTFKFAVCHQIHRQIV